MTQTRRQPAAAPARERGKPPRILAYGPLPPPYGGQAISFALLTDGLRAGGQWRVDVVNVGVPDWQPGQFTARRVQKTVATVLQSLARIPRADLLYLTIGGSRIAFLRDAVLVWWAWFWRKPIVARMDGGAFHLLYLDSPRWFRLAMRHTIARLTTLQALSPRIGETLKAIPGAPSRLEVVPDGTEEKLGIAPKSLPRDGPLRLLFLSQLMFDKGYADLMEAAKLLRERHPSLNIRLDFTGEFLVDPRFFPSKDAAREDFWRRVRSLGLEPVTVHHGLVTGEAKDRLLRDCHLFVLPTYYRFEGTPRSIREALSYAMPVVSTDWSGIPDLVADGVEGYLVPPQRPDLLMEALAKAVTTPERFASLSERAYARFQREFTVKAHVDKMGESFRRAMAKRR
ncbi:MAG: glycosyltransferase [Dehalococcoidia bacterium]|nr:glycosyltransferase [Dehalococcoidia bacterium]